MTVELNPVGVKCNLSCGYCYEDPMRDAGNFGPANYDLEKMKAGLRAEVGNWKPNRGSAFTLHGGEPLLMKLPDLAEIWRWGHQNWGGNAVQTNGSLITDEHIELAVKYRAHVGVSIDGPGEMNDLRWAGSLEKTRELTAKSEEAIEKLRKAGVATSVIIVLHRLNMDPEKRSAFKDWIRYLDDLGVSGVRFHPMEVDNEGLRKELLPTIEEYVEFYRDLYAFMKEVRVLRIDILNDIRKLLLGQDVVQDGKGGWQGGVTCTWNACDPLTTAAVRGVDGQGNRSNCGRTNKDGVAHPKADVPGYERNIALYYTPQEHGGCQGCQYFFACKGQCPGEGLDGDWRNRSEFCDFYKGMFRLVEEELLEEGKVPLSMTSKRHHVEQLLVEHWSRGQTLAVGRALDMHEKGWAAVPGGLHGDAPHGDSHGDHTDAQGANHQKNGCGGCGGKA